MAFRSSFRYGYLESDYDYLNVLLQMYENHPFTEKGYLVVSIVNGVINVFLDWLFMGPLDMGVSGAALATGLAVLCSQIIILVYFTFPNSSSLRFVRFGLSTIKELRRVCLNGASEMALIFSAPLSSQRWEMPWDPL